MSKIAMISSTRAARSGDKPARWVDNAASVRDTLLVAVKTAAKPAATLLAKRQARPTRSGGAVRRLALVAWVTALGMAGSTQATPAVTESGAEAAETGLATPHPRLRELEFFVGTWDAPGTFHETPFSPQKPIEMRVEVSSEERGFWILNRTTELPTPENPAPLTAHYLWGYDAAAEEFMAHWFDSNGGHAVQRSSGWEGNKFVFLGTLTTADGSSVPLRDTFTRTGPNSYHHIGAIDLGNGWIPVDEERATRVRQP